MQFIGKLSAGSSSPDFVDCSGITVDRTGNLLVSDSILNRIHVFDMASGQLTPVTGYGRGFYRSRCLAASFDGLLAVYQLRGVEDFDDEDQDMVDVEKPDEGSEDTPISTRSDAAMSGIVETRLRTANKHVVSIYRLFKADV